MGVEEVHIGFKIRLDGIDAFHVPFIIIAKNPQAVYIALEDVGDKIFIAFGIGPADTVLVNFRIDENLALVQVVPGLDFCLGINARDPVLVVDFQDVSFFFLVLRGPRIDHGHVGIMTAVKMEDFFVIDVLHQIAARRQDVWAVAALDEEKILIKRMDIPFYGMDDIFHIGRQIEQAVPFTGQSPFLPRPDMVQYGAGLG